MSELLLRSLSRATWRPIIWRIGTSVSAERAASIFRVDSSLFFLEHESSSSCRTLVPVCHTTQRLIPEDSNLHSHRRENMGSHPFITICIHSTGCGPNSQVAILCGGKRVFSSSQRPYRLWDARMITHLHLAPRWRMMEQDLHSPVRLHGVVLNKLSTRTTLALPLPYLGSRDSVVGITTGYGLDDRGVGVLVPVGSKIFSFARRPDRL
jgi:hypothetical protein